MAAESLARVVVAIAFAIGLAVIVGNPKVRRWEERFGLTVLAASGFPFLLLGLAFSRFNILSLSVLTDLTPAYEFGLGWIGFLVGTQLDVRRLDRLPRTLLPVIAAAAIPPILFAAVACSLVLIGFGVMQGEGLVRDVLILAACASVSAPANLKLLLRGCRRETHDLVLEVTRIDQLVALAILGFVAVTFRPDSTIVLWDVSRSGWFLITLGLGSILGWLVYILVRGAANRAEEATLVMGGVAIAAGVAGYLALSVAVVCALAGATLINFPIRRRDRLIESLRALERPLYLLFLFILGTTWQPEEWQGWVLGLVFALSRGYGKLVGSRMAIRIKSSDLPSAERFALSILPESAVAIVVIFTLATHGSSLPPAPVRWAINAVIVGSVATEIVVQTLQRRYRRSLERDALALEESLR